MKKIIIFLILGIVLFSIVISYQTSKKVIEDDKKNQENIKNKTTDKEFKELGELKPNGGGSNSEGTGTESGAEGTGNEAAGAEENETQLPEDIETSPCGFYFSDYDVCTGTCPSGTCVQEGRSCYCKEV